MRLRGVSALLGVGATVAAVLVFAGPAAAASIHCGSVLTSSVTLFGNLDCTTDGSFTAWGASPGPALFIAHDGVTVNLNGFTIFGYPDGPSVIQNYYKAVVPNGTLIQNGNLNIDGWGTIHAGTGGGMGVDNTAGGNSLVVSNTHITADNGVNKDYGTEGVVSYGICAPFVFPTGGGIPVMSTTVVNSTITGVGTGVDLECSSGSLIKSNTLSVWQYEDVYNYQGTNDLLSGNTMTNGVAGYPGNLGTGLTGVYAEESAGLALVGNTVNSMDYGYYDDCNNAGMVFQNNVFAGNNLGIDFSGNSNCGTSGGDSNNVLLGNYVKNSAFDGVRDFGSFNNMYQGNILTSSGIAHESARANGFNIEPAGSGPVTMVNNNSRFAWGNGYLVVGAFSVLDAPPYTLIKGNIAFADGSGGYYCPESDYVSPYCGGIYFAGFLDVYSIGATYTQNSGAHNASNGFEFYAPWREVISSNVGTMNGVNGFWFGLAQHYMQPFAITNNTATYNGVYGFLGSDPIAGSGNAGGGTNGLVDCYLVSGCS